MKILWLTWKDIDHPQAGGAEKSLHNIALRLHRDNHSLVVVTSRPKGLPAKSTKHGYTIIRAGNRYTVYWHAWRYYRSKRRGWADAVIEEVNTIPFFTRLYVKEPRRLFVHQLARKIWFYQYFFPLNVVGYLVEPLYLRFIAGPKVITISNSTKQDLMRHGHKSSQISIISEAIDTQPAPLPLKKLQKVPTFLVFGSVRSMKRPHLALKAFLIIKTAMPNAKLHIAGDNNSRYGMKIAKQVERSPYRNDIVLHGKVGAEQKVRLMQSSDILLATALKEGWGLTISEAARLGTPAIAFDVDGLRDSADCTIEESPAAMANEAVKLLRRKANYTALQDKAYNKSLGMTFDQAYRDFLQSLDIDGK